MKTEIIEDNKQKIAMEELQLNIKHQNIKVEKILQVGYKFDEEFYVFILLINLKGLKLNEN